MATRKLSPFGIGARVKVRQGSCLESSRWLKQGLVGEVIAFRPGIPGFGDGVIVRWPGEEPSPAFADVGQFSIVPPVQAS